ncbi:MAG TPA: hypothetical protein DEF51_36420 [Myxococcales bacterium]|nr:hypothetical protein [Myxococcales bacterium]
MTHVALLRGVNVGGKNKLPMKALVALFEDLGCEAVRTYIQSGNVIFEAKSTEGLADRIAARIETEHGLRVPVVLRTAEALARIRDDNPFPDADPKALHVMFLRDAPAKVRVKALDPDRSPGDAFVVRGANVYVCCPNGVARTKLTNAWFDAQLGTVSTGRNWRTLGKLIELSS